MTDRDAEHDLHASKFQPECDCEYTSAVSGRLKEQMKPLIILGSAPITPEDYNHALQLINDYDLLVVGIDAVKYAKQKIKYLATYHPRDLPQCQDKAYKIICHRQFDNMVDITKPIDIKKEPSGSSALLGTLVALDEGYRKIILCGCPLQGKNYKGQPYSAFHKGWLFHLADVAPYTRSMSGWTKTLLGEPTSNWLLE